MYYYFLGEKQSRRTPGHVVERSWLTLFFEFSQSPFDFFPLEALVRAKRFLRLLALGPVPTSSKERVNYNFRTEMRTHRWDFGRKVFAAKVTRKYLYLAGSKRWPVRNRKSRIRGIDTDAESARISWETDITRTISELEIPKQLDAQKRFPKSHAGRIKNGYQKVQVGQTLLRDQKIRYFSYLKCRLWGQKWINSEDK